MSECGAYLTMWEGEYEGICELPTGHEGLHDDGMTRWAIDVYGAIDWDSIVNSDPPATLEEP